MLTSGFNEPTHAPGRPPVQDWSEVTAQIIREVYLRTNLATDCGSMSHAVRRVVFDAKMGEVEIPAGDLAALDREMASKHYIPLSLKRQLMISKQVIRHHRDPRNAALSGPYVPGGTRLTQDGSRRLWAGERRSYDDGSQNSVIWYPWPYGGDRCSDTYGVRLGRGQWLVAHDDATGLVTSWTFTLRPRDSYRGPDGRGQMFRDARDAGAPDEVVAEGGIWQDNASLAFYQAAGMAVIDARGRPHLKLIEGWWSRAWTFLSAELRGQIGRYRGEYRRESELVERCRAGREDPRRHFPSLPELLTAFERCVAFHNQDRIESPEYGKWVPIERWEQDQARRPRREIAPELALFAAPERHELTVRRGGMVEAHVTCPLGIRLPYSFAHEALLPFEGAKVRVLFDPYEPLVEAAIVAARTGPQARKGDLLCVAACLTPPPAPVASEGWEIARDPSALPAAVAMKKAIGDVVRTEYRALGRGGRARVVLSERRGPEGVQRLEIGTAGDPRAGNVPAESVPTRGAPGRRIRSLDQLCEVDV
jgi:hypothetical protein